MTEPDVRAAIRVEADRLHESAVWSAQGQFEAAKWWRSIHWLLGILAALASTVAGVLVFAKDQQLLTAGLAIGGGVAAAAHTTLNPDRRAGAAQSSGNNYIALRNRARQIRDIHAAREAVATLSSLVVLTDDFAQVDARSSPPPRLAYRRAKRNIEEDGGQTFSADQDEEKGEA